MGLLDDYRAKLQGLLGQMPLVQMMRGEASVSPEGLKQRLMEMPIGPDAKGSYESAINVGGLPMGILGGIYKYAPKYRPPNSTNMPKGFSGIDPPSGEHKFGTVSYEKPLTTQELTDFELIPLDPKHPMNLKADFDKWRDGFLNDFSGNGNYEIKNKSGKVSGLVTEDARGDSPFRVTFLDGETPTGHISFSDFDELAKSVWGMTK